MKSNKRAIVSVGLFIIFVVLILSALMIQITEVNRGSFAHHVWTAIHVLCGLLFTILVILHIVFNWHTLKSYLKWMNSK
ncbi:hypothetical protein EZS27_036890 [termite gut metagenome]|uniref:Flavinylation-associated cytochrome domain-containing protein n=1 Tax=termite gut metagenome TaxID=433724 RepID=A0A5J4PSF5_9ZZZZ